MAGTANVTFTEGDQYWCVFDFFETPLLGTIVALTNAPGKLIGLQFEEEVPKGHTCDGRGEFKRCLWVGPQYIYSPDEWVTMSQVETQRLAVAKNLVGDSFKNITIDSDVRIVDEENQGNGTPGTQSLQEGKMPAIKE